MNRRKFSFGVLPALLLAPSCGVFKSVPRQKYEPSHASKWLDIALDVTAREVDRTGPRPTVLSRTLAIVMTAMYDAWAAYDEVAVGTVLAPQWEQIRRPATQRNRDNQQHAISQAMVRALTSMHPADADFIAEQAIRMGAQPFNPTRDLNSPAGVGNVVADALLASRANDNSNQENNYADTTGYTPVNTATSITDPDRWQPITFTAADGNKLTPGFLTPHWFKVRPFALGRADQFRPPPPPKVGSVQLLQEVAEVIELNARLSCQEKAIVEFMRDGPRSTGQSGHWLKFAQDVSAHNGYSLAKDVQLFFAVANVAMDAFIAAWDAKIAYDSSRPWTLAHHLFAGKEIKAWGGPNQGAITMLGENWHPYSPTSFITPPFPGYVSGHSCVSAACAEALRRFTGADRFGKVERRVCGELTGEHLDQTVELTMPTFSAAAEMAGRSRVLGGYHISADNIAGLALGRSVASSVWPVIARYLV